MIRAILDTNVIVQSVISSAPTASARVLEVYFDGRFRIVLGSMADAHTRATVRHG